MGISFHPHLVHRKKLLARLLFHYNMEGEIISRYRVSPIPLSYSEQLFQSSRLNPRRGGPCHFGENHSVIKSALQKGVRRNDDALIAYCLRETYLFYHMCTNYLNGKHDVAKNGERVVVNATIPGKQFNTNIINRCYTIAIEDCSPRGLKYVNACAKNLKTYKEESHPRNLMQAGLFLSACPPSRVCSHLRLLCGVDGPFFQRINQRERAVKELSIPKRLQIIYEALTDANNFHRSPAFSLDSLRINCAYHILQIYCEIKRLFTNYKMDCQFPNNVIHSSTIDHPITTPLSMGANQRMFENFWNMCRAVVASLSKENQMINKFQQDVLAGLNWRQDFFQSTGEKREDNLVMISAVEMLIATAYGPSNEFETIQLTAERLQHQLPISEEFDWSTDHQRVDLPQFVYDQHTRGRKRGSSFALEGCKVIDGDENWTPRRWLDAYRTGRRRQEMMEDHFISAELFPASIWNEAMKHAEQFDLYYSISRRPAHPAVVRAIKYPQVNRTRKRQLSISTSMFYGSKRKARKIEHPPQQLPKQRKKRCGDSTSAMYQLEIDSLPELRREEIQIIAHCNSNSRKVPVVVVRGSNDDDDDDTLFVVKAMPKKFNFGMDQNFMQIVKDLNLCDFQYLHALPPSGVRRGLMMGWFEMRKEQFPELAPSNKGSVFFVTGHVTQEKGVMVNPRLSWWQGEIFNPKTSKMRCLEIIHIIAFRMLFGVNDTNTANILVGEQMRLYSVDENFIGSKTKQQFVRDRGCQILKKLLRKQDISSMDVEAELPPWMSNEEKRVVIMDKIFALGQKNWVPPETLRKVEENSMGIKPALMNFLFGDCP